MNRKNKIVIMNGDYCTGEMKKAGEIQPLTYGYTTNLCVRDTCMDNRMTLAKICFQKLDQN